MSLTNHPEFEKHGFTWGEVGNLLKFARQRLREERLDEVAGSLTFTTVLALVPMLTIAFAIFTSFPLFNTMRDSLEAYFIQSLMPKAISNTILGYLTMFASKASGLSSVGAVALLVTSITMMSTIERAFNQIWRVKQVRPVVQRFLVYWAILTLGPLLIGFSISVSSHLFVATSNAVGASRSVTTLFYTVLSIGLSTIAFGFLYLAVPNRLIDWRDAAWGGLAAAIAFEIAKRLFAEFIARFPSYAVIYGALAAVPLFLVWIYLSWLITLAGAALVAALPVIKYERWWHQPGTGTIFVDAMTLLRPLVQARLAGKQAQISGNALRLQTRLGIDEIDLLMQKMSAMGWVGRLKSDAKARSWSKRYSDGQDEWALLANPDQLKVADVYRLFVFDGNLPHGADEALSAQVNAVIEQGLGQTLSAWMSSPATEVAAVERAVSAETMAIGAANDQSEADTPLSQQ
ncbi:MAG: YihY family inner membrane protein [Burkholderiales bacterium]|nr:YihY family inner membrane protein [Burkholderiales bacterium]